MMKLLDTTTRKLMMPDKAEATANELNATDDWTYKVRHDPTGKGWSFIEIYDEDGEFVGYWT